MANGGFVEKAPLVGMYLELEEPVLLVGKMKLVCTRVMLMAALSLSAFRIGLRVLFDLSLFVC